LVWLRSEFSRNRRARGSGSPRIRRGRARRRIVRLSELFRRRAEHEFAFAPGAIAITVTDASGASSISLGFDGGRG